MKVNEYFMKTSVTLKTESSIGIDMDYLIRLNILVEKLHRDKPKQIRMWVDDEFKKLGITQEEVVRLVQEEFKKK